MQLSQLIRIDNGRWTGVFGGVAGGVAATVVPQLSTLSSDRVALLGGLLTLVVFLLLVVVANLAGVLPTNAQDNETTGSS
ncbi:hypothetical protein [Halonotius roseus]|uniref:Uncharacterized protein n=1 Tax=Halonotius roseus TaxID=2511997 RepID=A0A544QRB7_9EURY|nr:hypothetical protein [Halonotius roseus]TQQ81984.1 hypothetical protein EWF95_03330 [Halonotius roseus]